MSIPPGHPAEDSPASASSHPYSDASPVLPTDRRLPKWLILFKPKVGIPLAILIVLVSIPLAIRNWRISSLPQIDEPFDIEAFCSVTIPDDDNAFVEYREAFDLFVEFRGKNNDWESYKELLKGKWNDVPPAFPAWIKSNDRAFHAWLDGTAKPGAMFMPRRDLSYSAIDYTDTARSLIRVAMLRAGRNLHDGNTAEAWKILHAAFRFSRHVGQNGPTIERHTGIAILPLVCTGLLSWAHHANTTARDLEHAIAILPDEFASMTPLYSETLKHEYLAEQDFLRDSGPRLRIFTNLPAIDSGLIFVLGEPEFSLTLLDLHLANQVAGIDLTPSARPKLIAGDARIFDIPAVPGKTISGVDLQHLLSRVSVTTVGGGGLPWMSHSIYALNLERTFESTMIAVLSIEYYVRKHARFPSSLAEFPESCAKALFADPLHSSSGNIIYRAAENFSVVYGLGEDGFDDGHRVAPPERDEQASWDRLDDSRGRFEGYRIPLWRPASADDKAASVESDNVQD
tara:strand:+ start:56974 stop:58512 length:1539 start_codon:yes stop_codon:yes gene_type:complete